MIGKVLKIHSNQSELFVLLLMSTEQDFRNLICLSYRISDKFFVVNSPQNDVLPWWQHVDAGNGNPALWSVITIIWHETLIVDCYW